MNLKTRKYSKSIKLTAQGEISVFDAPELKNKILSSMEKTDKITFIWEKVESCDVSGLQVLLAARRSAGNQNKIFEISDIPESVKSTMKKTGIRPEDFV